MKGSHSPEWLPIPVQTRAFIALLILTIVVLIGLAALDGPLRKEHAPCGIISLELVGNLSGAQNILKEWGETGKVYAGLSLVLDYLFIVTYSNCIALACLLTARCLARRTVFPFLVGLALVWAQYGAALLDALENYALIRLLLDPQREIWPALAKWCAIPKFAIVITGLAFVLVGGIIAITMRPGDAKEPAAS